MARRFPLLPTLLMMPLLGLAEQPARVADQPLRVTTDNDAYCQVLLGRIGAAPAASSPTAAQLAEAGRQLCTNGHPRTGIAKLRRALRVAMAEAD